MKNYALSPLLMMSFRACHLPSNASEVAFWPSRDIFPPKRHPRIRYCVFPHCALKDNFISLQGIVKVKCVTSSHLVGIFRFLCYKALIFVLKMYVSNALWIRLGEFLKKSTRPRAGQMALRGCLPLAFAKVYSLHWRMTVSRILQWINISYKRPLER